MKKTRTEDGTGMEIGWPRDGRNYTPDAEAGAERPKCRPGMGQEQDKNGAGNAIKMREKTGQKQGKNRSGRAVPYIGI
jgi:hypothetical protein